MTKLTIGENSRRMLRGLAAVGPFFIAARVLTAVAQILAGRWLGPVQFGKATVVIAGSGILFIPLVIGFPGAVVKFASMEENAARRSLVVSTNFWMMSLWTMLCATALFLADSPVSAVAHIPADLYGPTLLYAVLLAVFTFLASAIQGLMRFSMRGGMEFIYGLSMLLVFMAVYWSGSRTYRAFIGAMDVALILASAASLHQLRHVLRVAWEGASARVTAAYSGPLIVSGIAGAVLSSASPLLLAARLSNREVGYYGAYTMGSLTAAMVLFQVLNIVLAPLVSSLDRNRGAWRKFKAIFFPVAAGAFLVFCMAQITVLKLMGKNYPIEFPWIAAFSASGIAYLAFFTVMSTLSVRDISGAWLGTAGTVLAGVFCAIGNVLGIRNYGFVGAPLGLIAGYGIGLAWCVFWGLRSLESSA